MNYRITTIWDKIFVIVLYENQIYTRMTVQYCDNYMRQRKVYEWVKDSKDGGGVFSIARSVLLPTVTCVGVEVKKQIDHRI
jgi:hypothetical protein